MTSMRSTKRKTPEEFVRNAIAIHGDAYSYDKFVYVNAHTKGTIICKLHGEFEQSPRNHVNQKNGCSECGILKRNASNLKGRDRFIQEATAKHQGAYSYEKFVYVHSKTKGIIICKEHGEFLQSPNPHLKGVGCPACGFIKTGNAIRKSRDTFIREAEAKHRGAYTYDKFVYAGAQKKGVIRCKKHGDFEQAPLNHVTMGQGCPKCGAERFKEYALLYCRKDLDTFIREATEKHQGKYSYDKFVYVNTSTNGTINCKDHGDFEQSPSVHLQGCGCPGCGVDKHQQYSRSIRKDRDTFIREAKERHGDTYDYSKFVYAGNRAKGIIICAVHREFEQAPHDHIGAGHGCPKCARGQKSRPEIEICEWIVSQGFKTEENGRLSCKRYRFDCVVHSKKVAIEFNGIYWHSDKRKSPGYHIKKREYAERHGYRMVTIWEDDFRKDPEGMFARLSAILSSTETVLKGKLALRIDLDYQSLPAYLEAGYELQGVIPQKQQRGKHTVYNSGTAYLKRARKGETTLATAA